MVMESLYLKGPVVSVETLPALVFNGVNVYRPVSWIRRCEATLMLRHRGVAIGEPLYHRIDEGKFMGCLQDFYAEVTRLRPKFYIEVGDQLRIDLDVKVCDWPGIQDGDDLNAERYSPVPTIAVRTISDVPAIYNTLEHDLAPLRAWMEEQRKAVRG